MRRLFGYLTLLSMLLILSGCQLISGISSDAGSAANAVTTSRQLDQILTSLNPPDASTLTLDGYTVLTFDSEIDLYEDTPREVTLTRISDSSPVILDASVVFDEALGAYQIYLNSENLLTPNTAYTLTLGEDFVFSVDGEYQKLGTASSYTYTTPRSGGIDESLSIFYAAEAAGDDFVLVGGTQSSAGNSLQPAAFLATYNQISSSWETSSTAALSDYTYSNDAVAAGIGYSDGVYYTIIPDEDPDPAITGMVIVYSFWVSGGEIVIGNSVKLQFEDSTYVDSVSASSIDITIVGSNVYIPLAMVDGDNDIPYIVTCDTDINSCTATEIWTGTGFDKKGLLDIKYCDDGKYYLSGYGFNNVVDPDEEIQCAVLQSTDTLPPPGDLTESLLQTGICNINVPTMFNEVSCGTTSIFTGGVIDIGSVALVSFDASEYELNWKEIIVSGVASAIENPGRITMPIDNDGANFVYTSSGVQSGYSLDVYNMSTGDPINSYFDNKSAGWTTDINYTDSQVVMTGGSIIGIDTYSGGFRILDRRGNYVE